MAYLAADAADVATDSGASDTSHTIKLVLGVLFLFLAAKQWRSVLNPTSHRPRRPSGWPRWTP